MPSVRLILPLAVLVASAFLLVATHLTGRQVQELFGDPGARFSLPIQAGGLSYLGILLMTVAAAVTGFTASILRGGAGVLWVVAALSGIVAVDDLLGFHDRVWLKLGGPEVAIHAAYALAAAWIAWAHGFGAPVRERWMFWASLACLALPVVNDIAGRGTLDPLGYPGKLAGITLWTAHWFGHCQDLIRARIAAGGAG